MTLSLTDTFSGYSYDPVGNLTNIAYPASGTVKFAYDALNRLTTMVDSIGTTHYAYDAAGQLLTEGGLFSSDYVTNTYSKRRRIALSLQQPTGSWANGFGWDLAGRLTNVTSAAGAFGYNELTAAPSRTYTSYDANGNPTAATVSGAPVSLTYDDENRLLSLTVSGFGSSTYTYDGLGGSARALIPGGRPAMCMTACASFRSGIPATTPR